MKLVNGTNSMSQNDKKFIDILEYEDIYPESLEFKRWFHSMELSFIDELEIYSPYNTVNS